ncbi:hypothetical protein GLI01_02920 [Gluconacetobacter liquefaciens]|nr:hypothetical protein GLI01_02920 [Gluconacetobacter liquefaciens]
MAKKHTDTTTSPNVSSGTRTVVARKRAATTRSTGGAGFDFEDRVAASLLLRMVSGEAQPAIEGSGIHLQTQTEPLGWKIDDLLVTTSSARTHQRLAISCKSNVQVTRNGFQPEFAGRVLQQWREGSTPFNRATDHLALASRGHNADFEATWADIKGWCEGPDPALALSRINASRKHRTVFDSLRSPAGYEAASDVETVEIIRRLHVLPFDFQLAQSNDNSRMIAQCRQLLVSRSQVEAENLWKDIIDAARDTRLGSGTLPFTVVWDRLRKKYALRAHPDYAASWDTLSTLTIDYRDNIQTELPAGYTVDRSHPRAELEELIKSTSVAVVLGDSGVGKSALVKDTLDDRFTNRNQVWLGPDELAATLSAVKRLSLSLSHPLPEVLNATSHARNVLVLDSAERFSDTDLVATKRLIELITAPSEGVEDATWRIVIVSQQQNWRTISQRLLVSTPPKVVTVNALNAEQVRAALLSSLTLRWLATHNETVVALTNLKTLSWVMTAGGAMGTDSGALASHTAIADQLWDFWTNGRLDVQGLIMRLARREASFERSFAISALDPADATIFQNRPSQLPLFIRRNRIEFEHDLAADWARFQHLKEIADDVPTWAAYAVNPLWTGALRMLGQYLLREKIGAETAWDQAFRAVEGGQPPLAMDVLLDAICLDPEAERFLNERAEFLFANRGRWLDSLLRRFRHVASMPSVAPTLLNADTSMGLYLDANFRTLVIGRWPPIANFLAKHEARVADLMLPSVSAVCETWLNGVSSLIGDTPTPYRKEFAQLALRIAQVVQADKMRGTIYSGHDDLTFFSSALAGAPDFPEKVAAWALEMVGRREPSDFVRERVAEANRKEAEKRAERLGTDLTYRAAEQKRGRSSRGPMMISSTYALPAWPLGPQHRLDRDFVNMAFKSNPLMALMHANPAAAAELLIALHIEDNPEEKFGSSTRIEPELGLSHQREAYPSAFWKSPFFSFLQIAPKEAVGALIALVNFATERWAADQSASSSTVPSIDLLIGDVIVSYPGDGAVFCWGQTNSFRNGTLFSTLDALERWLTIQLQYGYDCSEYIERLLAQGKSTAFLGVLTNVAKFEPKLLAGQLAPLHAHPAIFIWDEDRVKEIGQSFDAWHWVKLGDKIFEFAKAWVFAPHRMRTLRGVAVDLLKTDPVVAAALKQSCAAWEFPKNTTRATEIRTLQATLDYDNYRPGNTSSESNRELAFKCPDELQREIEERHSVQEDRARGIVIPYQCKEWLGNGAALSDQNAQEIADYLQVVETNNTLDEEVKTLNALALSSALIGCCYPWISGRPETFERACVAVKAAALSTPDDAEGILRYRISGFEQDIPLWGHAVMKLWMHDVQNREVWEPLVLRLLSSGDARAVGIVSDAAYQNRAVLGDAWWRVLQLGLFWSALVMLAPYHDDNGIAPAVWNRWLAKFRRMKIFGVKANADALDLHRIIKGYERLEADGWQREFASDRPGWHRRDPADRTSIGLETRFLSVLFQWLLGREQPLGADTAATELSLCLKLWDAEVRNMKARQKEDGEYPLPSDLGYDLVRKFASMIVVGPADQAPKLWEAVFALGNDGHAAVEQFINAFMLLPGKCDAVRFCAAWREMIVFSLAQGWEKRNRWYYGERYLRSLLGFGHAALTKLADRAAAVHGLKDLYKLWAEAHLRLKEDNVVGFAYFLAGEFAAPIRLEGIQWLASGIANGTVSTRFSRDQAGPALVELLDAVINENSIELQRNRPALEAVIAIAAELVAKNIDNAFVLQERIKLLR